MRSAGRQDQNDHSRCRSGFDRGAPRLLPRGRLGSSVEGLSDYRERPAGTVRLNLSRVAAEILVASKLPAFAAAYPDIHVELTVEDQFSDIVGSGDDAGVRPGGWLHQDMIAVRLTPDLRIAIVGSPAYFERNPTPRVPKDLAQHACINYRWTESGALYRWAFSKA